MTAASNSALVTRWQERAEAAEALVAEKDAEIERLKTAGIEEAVVDAGRRRTLEQALQANEHLAEQVELAQESQRRALADAERAEAALAAEKEAHEALLGRIKQLAVDTKRGWFYTGTDPAVTAAVVRRLFALLPAEMLPNNEEA